jgi:hypothetical protein
MNESKKLIFINDLPKFSPPRNRTQELVQRRVNDLIRRTDSDVVLPSSGGCTALIGVRSTFACWHGVSFRLRRRTTSRDGECPGCRKSIQDGVLLPCGHPMHKSYAWWVIVRIGECPRCLATVRKVLECEGGTIGDRLFKIEKLLEQNPCLPYGFVHRIRIISKHITNSGFRSQYSLSLSSQKLYRHRF